MKLIKINTDHYVVVDNSEIKEGDWYVGLHNKVVKATDGKHYAAEALRLNGKSVCKITHSTQPLYKNDFWAIQELKLSEVKELIGEIDVEKKAEYDWMLHTEGSIVVTDKNDWKSGFHHGYNQALEDNKNKKYTEEDSRKIFIHGKQLGLTVAGSIRNGGDKPNQDMWFNESIESLQSKTEWEVEIVDGKLKLKQ